MYADLNISWIHSDVATSHIVIKQKRTSLLLKSQKQKDIPQV